MGFFDEVKCEAPLPDGRMPPGSWFQTKALYCLMDRFTITAQGRLIHHQCRLDDAEGREVRPGIIFPQFRRVPVADVDMEYHGDIKFYGQIPADSSFVDYVARFTNGTLEWIRPYESLSEAHQMWFYSKS